MNLKQRAKKLKTDLPAVFLALKRTETPVSAKIFSAIAVIYALSPIDLIPDFIPILGYIDDLLLLPAIITLAVKSIPEKILEECRTEAENLWKDGKPKRWYYALPFLVIWFVIIVWVLKILW